MSMLKVDGNALLEYHLTERVSITIFFHHFSWGVVYNSLRCTALPLGKVDEVVIAVVLTDVNLK